MGNLNTKKNIEEVVANCDQLGEVVANCDKLEGAVTKCDIKSL